MKHILIILIISANAFATSEVIHSSVSAYYESKTFSNSVQKTDGTVHGVGADIHYKNSEYKFAYESGATNTKQPPLPKDLHIDKLFLRYIYGVNNTFSLNVNYLNILHDNLAITDEGKAYGLGFSYKPSKQFSTNITQYYTNYKDFKVYQTDLKLDTKMKIQNVKIKLSSITKYIDIKETKANTFTKNAQSDYLTSALKLHAHYEAYHFGAGAYFGKRAFAIMDNGFKIQHHAMEFNKTYALGFGKNISNFVVRLQYVYQEAEELPSLNDGVQIKNWRLITNYKF